ncbi:MAG: T9SS type A sorting domain-containing protein [Rhodothermales bacterium]|nr:T9SS type A sorting domain-containing protein [Rhodothermales bacterium]
MPKIILFCLLATASTASSQVTGDFRSAGSDSWELSSTWETYNGVAWIPAILPPELNDETITIRDGHDVTVTTTMDIDQVVIESSATLIIANSKTLRIQDGAGDDFVVFGTVQTIGDIELEVTSSAHFQSGSVLDNDGKFQIVDFATVVFDGTALLDNSDTFKIDNDGQATFNSGTTVLNIGSFNPKGNSFVTFNDASVTNEDEFKVEGNSTITFNTGSVYEHAINGGKIGKTGSMTWNTGSTCVITGTIDKIPDDFDQVFANLVWNSPGQTTDINFDHLIVQITGSFTLASTGTGFVSWLKKDTDPMVVDGDFNVSGGVFVAVDGDTNPVISVGGNLNISGGLFDFSTGDGRPELHIAGDMIQTGGTITETGTGGGLIVFDGSATQTVHHGATISNEIVSHVDNASGVELTSDWSPPDSTVLVNGNMVTSSNKMVIGAATTLLTPGGYIDGALQKTFPDTGSKTYEVGSSSGYSPVDVVVTAGSGEVTVRATGASLPEAANEDETLNRHWSISAAGVTQADLVLHYLETDFPTGLKEDGVELTQYDGESFSFPFSVIDTVANTVSIDGVVPAGDWTLVKLVYLPVEITALATVVDGRNVTVTWETGENSDSFTYELELAQNDGPFVSVAFLNPSTVNQENGRFDYMLADLESGHHRLRLSKIDANGRNIAFAITEFYVSLEPGLLVEAAYPNPFGTSTTVRVGVSESAPVRVELLNSVGQLIDVLHDSTVPANQMIPLKIDADRLPSGIYYVRATAREWQKTTRIIVLH